MIAHENQILSITPLHCAGKHSQCQFAPVHNSHPIKPPSMACVVSLPAVVLFLVDYQ